MSQMAGKSRGWRDDHAIEAPRAIDRRAELKRGGTGGASRSCDGRIDRRPRVGEGGLGFELIKMAFVIRNAEGEGGGVGRRGQHTDGAAVQDRAAVDEDRGQGACPVDQVNDAGVGEDTGDIEDRLARQVKNAVVAGGPPDVEGSCAEAECAVVDEAGVGRVRVWLGDRLVCGYDRRREDRVSYG